MRSWQTVSYALKLLHKVVSLLHARSHANQSSLVLVTVLKIIINEAWNLQSLDIGKLAKYMRCLFQVALSSDTEIAEQLLDGVGTHAQEAEHVSSSILPIIFAI